MLQEREIDKMNGESGEDIVGTMPNVPMDIDGQDSVMVNDANYTTASVSSDDNQLHKVGITVEIDPNTGMYIPVNPDTANLGRVDATLDDVNNEEIFDNVKLSSENVDTLKQFDLNDDEANELLQLILVYQKGDDKHLYSRLPKKIKGTVGQLAQTNNMSVLNSVAKDMLDMFVGQMKVDQGYMDLDQAITKEIGELDQIGDMYKEYDREKMDGKMLELAEKFKETNPEKSEKFLKIREVYLDATSFKTIKERLQEDHKDTRRLDKAISKYEKLCTDFNYKYKHSTLSINDVRLVAKCIARNIDPKYTGEDIYKFTALFCRIALNMSPKDIFDHTYMFYTIKTVLMLDILQVDKENYAEIVKNIEEVLDLIIKKG